MKNKKEGKKEGKKEMQTAVVKAMLDKNMPIDLIAEVTKLTEDEIKDIN